MNNKKQYLSRRRQFLRSRATRTEGGCLEVGGYADDRSQSAIAASFGVLRSLVQFIKAGKRRKA